MKICALKKVLEIFSKSPKYQYELYAWNNNNNYKFSISNDGIDVTISNKNTDYDINLDITDLQFTVGDLKLKKLVEIRYYKGIEVEHSEILLLREVELYIKLFKTMGSQASFVIQNDQEIKLCYYITNRVFYVNIAKDVYELREESLFKIFSSMPRAEVTLVSYLPNHYSYSDFYSAQNKLAISMNKKFLNLKRGVLVNA